MKHPIKTTIFWWATHVRDWNIPGVTWLADKIRDWAFNEDHYEW